MPKLIQDQNVNAKTIHTGVMRAAVFSVSIRFPENPPGKGDAGI